MLVVDDDRQLLGVLSRVLDRAGYTTLTAVDRPSALAAARAAETIDVLVTDVNVPGARGRDLATAVAAVHPRVHVLYISGFPLQQIEDEGIVTTASTFLHKPFKPTEFVAAVDAAAARAVS